MGRPAAFYGNPESTMAEQDQERAGPEESTGGQRSMAFAAPVHVSGSPSSAVFLAYSLKPLEAELAPHEDDVTLMAKVVDE